MKLKDQIAKYISENILFSEGGFPYGGDASFLQEGIVDSMGVLELVMYVSSSFGIEVDPLEVTPENFDSVNRLAAYIRRKQEAQLAPALVTAPLEVSDVGSTRLGEV
jgi:acyl carrier protein